MNVDQARELFVALGSKAQSNSNEWVRGPCPLAPWRHKSGKDSNPSFGLNIAQGTNGRFHCFSCESGSLSKLLQTIEFHLLNSTTPFHGNLGKAREIIENEEVELPVLPEYSEFSGGTKKQFQELPTYFLESFVPVAANQRARLYLEHRGFTLAEAQQFDLRYDKQRDMILFPYKDVFGRFAGIRGRQVQFPGEHSQYNPHHDYVWNEVNNASLVWLGEGILDSPGPVVVVEGQFDWMRVKRVYPRVIANLTAKPVLEKVTKLTQTDGVILMLDGDLPGREGTKKFAELLDMLGVPVAVILCPYDVDDKGAESKSDPDSLGEAWISAQLKEVGALD